MPESGSRMDKAKEIVSRRALSYARIVIVEESDLLHGRE